MDEKEIKVKSLYKALTILDLFTGESKELSVTAVAEQTGMLKSSVHNILSTFAACGYVEKSARSNKFRLGKKILQLYHVYNKNNPFLNKVKGLMLSLSQEIGETVYLAVRNGDNILYLDSVSPSSAISSSNVQGFLSPMHCTGLGKAILAECEDETLERIAHLPLKRYTENTITEPERLLEEIQLTRARGYAIDNMEHEFGIKCVSKAFRDQEGHLYGISISGPSLRFPQETIERYVRKLNDVIAELDAY